MSISLIVSGIGAVVAAIGTGMLMARCLRAPRGDLIAWSVALVGLFLALAAQTLGHLAGFSQASFRAMEIGAQVLAPLALIMGIAEVVATSLPGRFAARLFIPAFAFIPLVIFAVDPLSGTAFTKAWPAPTVYYQIIPNKLLEYGLAPVSLLLALIFVGIVAYRASRSHAWRAMLPAAAAAGIAVVALVISALGVTLPLTSLFALLCLVAAALAWYAGISASRVPLTALRDGTAGTGRAGARRAGTGRDGASRDGASRGGAGRDGAGQDGAGQDGAYDDQEDDLDQGGWGRSGQWGDHTGDFESYDDGSQGVYRGGGLYRDEPAGSRHAGGGHPGDDSGYGWQGNGDDYDSRELDAVYGPGGYDTGSLDAAGVGSHNGYDSNGRPLDHDPLGRDPLGQEALDRDPLGQGALGRDPLGRDPLDSHAVLENGALAHGALAHGALAHEALDHEALDHEALDHGALDHGPGRPEPTRAELFGQIAIYTLIEDQVHEFDRLTERIVGKVRAGEPDTLVYIVHAVPSAPMQRILYEVYRDRSAYDRHQQQPYVTEFEADRRPYVLATNVIELGLQQAKVSPFPSIADLFGEPGYDTSGFERPDYTREYGSSAGQNGTAR